jgi:hypothetical protein
LDITIATLEPFMMLNGNRTAAHLVAHADEADKAAASFNHALMSAELWRQSSDAHRSNRC